MGFGAAVKSVYSKYATFSGRASRSEYWWFVLFYGLVVVVLSAVMGAVGGVMSATMMSDPGDFSDTGSIGVAIGMGVISLLIAGFCLGSLIPIFAVFVRRYHDVGLSGWWVLALLVLNWAGYGYAYWALLNGDEMAFVLLNPGAILYIVTLLATVIITLWRGTRGPNRFGPDPLAPMSDTDDDTMASSLPNVARS